jgi:hypothetical protein
MDMLKDFIDHLSFRKRASGRRPQEGRQPPLRADSQVARARAALSAGASGEWPIPGLQQRHPDRPRLSASGR